MFAFQCLEKPWAMNHWQALLGVLLMIILVSLFFCLIQRKPVIVRKLFNCCRGCCGCCCKPKVSSESARDEAEAESEEKERLEANES